MGGETRDITTEEVLRKGLGDVSHRGDQEAPGVRRETGGCLAGWDPSGQRKSLVPGVS